MSILDRLTGGDFRSIGNSEQVVADVLTNTLLFAELFDGLTHSGALIRMRAADAAEKVTAVRPDLLRPFKSRLLNEVASINQQEVRWHVAQMIPRLALTKSERHKAIGIMRGYLSDKSSIVKTFSMQALADLAEQDKSLEPEIISLLEELTQTGTPAMKSRGRKLLTSLHRKS